MNRNQYTHPNEVSALAAARNNPYRTADRSAVATPAEPALAMQYFPVVPLLLLLGGVLALGADMLFSKSLFDLATNQSEAASWVISFAIALASTIVAATAGAHMKNAKRTTFWVAGSLWFLMGVVVAVLRASMHLMTGDPSTLMTDRVIAVVMFAIYLGAGTDIMIQASKLADRRYLALWGSKLELWRTTRKLARLQSQLDRTDDVAKRLNEELERLDEEVTIQNRMLNEIEETYKQRARLRIAFHLGDPEATELYRGETWPQPQVADEGGAQAA